MVSPTPFNYRVSTRYSDHDLGDLGGGHGIPTRSTVSMLLSLLSILPGVRVQVAKAARPIANPLIGNMFFHALGMIPEVTLW